MKIDKRNEYIKYALLGAAALTFYYRAEIFNVIHPPDPAIAIIQAGARAYRAGNYKEAVAESELILNRFPNSDKARHAHLLRGMSMQKLGSNQGASVDLHFVAEHYPGTVEARVASDALRQIAAQATVKAKQTGPPQIAGDNPPDPNALVNVRSPGDFVGKWASQPTRIDKQGLCTLIMEIRAQQQGFTAYPQLGCMPLMILQNMKRYEANPIAFLMKGTPTSAILSGAWDKDYRSLVFNIDKITSTSGSQCTLNGDITVTPFGGSQLAVEWKDSCGGAQFLISRQPATRSVQ